VNPGDGSPRFRRLVDYVTAVPHPRSEPQDLTGPAAAALPSPCSAAPSARPWRCFSTRQKLVGGHRDGGRRGLSADRQGSDVTGVPASLAIVGPPRSSPSSPSAAPGASWSPRCSRSPARARSSPRSLGASDSSALDEKAAAASGNTAATADALSPHRLAVRRAVGGALLLLAGLLALRYGGCWPAMSGRYERDGTPRPRKARPFDPDRPRTSGRRSTAAKDPTGPDPAGT